MIRPSSALRPPPPRDDPSSDQTPDQIAKYYRNAVNGAPAALRHTQYGRLRFTVTEIEGITHRSGRVYVRQGCEWGGKGFYVKSGKSCDAPTGQTHLVVPTPEILSWIERHPDGSSDWR
jgi:hypothetical protein